MNAQQRARLNELRIANAARNNYTLLVAEEPKVRTAPVKEPSQSTLTEAQRARLNELRAKQASRVAGGAHPMAAATERLTALRNETQNLGIIGTINEMTRIAHDTARQMHDDAHQQHINLVDHQNHMNHLMMNQ